MLLRLRFGDEARMSRLDRLLIGDGARVSGRLRVELRLLACLGFLDRSRVGGDTALGTQLRLALHLGALECDACCIPVGFSACGRLCGTRAFRSLSGPRHRESAALRVGRGSHPRFVRHREGLERRGSWRRVTAIASFGRELIVDAFVGGASTLLAVALDFAPDEFGAAYVM
jgi:hypothetical protein